MKVNHVLLISLLIVGLLFVPAVSATEIINESLTDFTDTSKTGELYYAYGGKVGYEIVTGFFVRDVSLFDDISYFTLEVSGTQGYWPSGELIPEGRHETTYTYNGETKPAVIYVSRNTNSYGTITSTKYIFFPQNWNRQGLTGEQVINTPLNLIDARGNQEGKVYYTYTTPSTTTNLWVCNENGEPRTVRPITTAYFTPTIGHVTSISWVNNLRVTTTDDEVKGYTVELIRTVNGIPAQSTLEIYKDDSIVYRNSGMNDLLLWFPQSDINKINITSPVRTTYSYDLNLYTPGEPSEPGDTPVVVYVKSSQTGALLADAQIIIKDTATTPWTEVVNQTLTSGQGTFSLAKDLGFNLTQYQITAKVPGYQQVVKAQFFRVTGPISVVVEMEPTEGGPADEDNTFLEFYVRDLNGNGISNAQVFVDGQMRWTNAEGFTQFEVAKNNSYSYTVSKSGYLTIKGSATVGDGPRYTVNVVLGPDTVPTQPPVTDPDTSTVNVYVKSSQTGALLADAHIVIKDTTTDPWTEVVNQTLTSGYGTFSLAKDPGFNPTQYHISATVPGYQQVVKALFFRVTGTTNVVVEMEPIEGGPSDENNTFLEFYVRNLDGNPVSNAMVSVAGQTRWTNAQGWTQFEVVKNASYSYTVSKSGYATIEGSVTVGDGPRYVVNVDLGPKDIPTQPPGPGMPTLEPTPTSDIPGDDGSQGFLSEAVRAISKIFGVGFSTAKMLLGMLLALAIGFATAKQLRGGAMEFGLGLLGGTMLGVLIGLLPVWTIVVLLLVVGMYIGYRYVGGGSNG